MFFTIRRLVLLSCALCAGLLGGCGGESEAEQFRASHLQPASAAEPVPWGVDPVFDTPLAGAPEADEAGYLSAADAVAKAVSRSMANPYRFEQGVSIRLGFGSAMALVVAPEDAAAWGEVVGDRLHLTTDLGLLYTELAEQLDDPALGALGSSTIELWSNDSIVVLDLGGFLATADQLYPVSATNASLFGSGPIAIDPDQVPGFDAGSFAGRFGQGAFLIDPASLLPLVGSLPNLVSRGQMQLSTEAVSAYESELGLSEFLELAGVDTTAPGEVARLLGLDELQDLDPEIFRAGMADTRAHVRIMVDGSSRLRRVEVDLNFTQMLRVLYSDPLTVEHISLTTGMGSEDAGELARTLSSMWMRLGTWQDFHGYDDAIVVDLPAALEATSEFARFHALLS